MELLYALEAIRTPFLDQLFSLFTQLGSELIFIVVAVSLYWCVDKTRGLYLLSVGCLGTTLNQFLKITCRVPRPWVKDPSFTIVESARAGATGYSFPSGHTQNAVGTYGALARMTHRTWVRVVLIVIAAGVAFSRMYLGVHTPWDVGTSLALATVLVLGLYPLFRNLEDHPERGFGILLGLGAVNLLYLCYAKFWPFPADADPVLQADGLSNAAKLTGALVGMALGYLLDCKRTKFSTKAPLPGQILKVVLGLALLLVLKSGIKALLGSSLPVSALRYGIMTFFAAGIWPMTFPWFAKLGKRRTA